MVEKSSDCLMESDYKVELGDDQKEFTFDPDSPINQDELARFILDFPGDNIAVRYVTDHGEWPADDDYGRTGRNVGISTQLQADRSKKYFAEFAAGSIASQQAIDRNRVLQIICVPVGEQTDFI